MISNGSILAGVGQTDITPSKDIVLGGATINGKIRVDYIKDPLYANTLIVESNHCKLCIVSLDLLMITRSYVELIREEARRRWGFDLDAVMIHATQNHKSPSLGHFKISEDYNGIPDELNWLRGGDDRFHKFAYDRILQSIEIAHGAMEPVQIGAASGIEGRMAFNRRMIMRDGSIKMPSFQGPPDPQSRCLEGKKDPELGVVCFRSKSQQIHSLLLNYTCHPVHKLKKFFISADWPGELSTKMKERCGNSCTSLVLNGACGNINPWDPFANAPRDDAEYMGEILAETVHNILETITFQDETVLDWKVKHIKIPLRKLNEKEVEEAQKYVSEHPTPQWVDDVHVDGKWVIASGLLDLHEQYERQPLYDYEIQVLRIGDTAFVGLPGEPFAEAGLEIKLASPTFPTYIVHNTQFAGYIPTKEAFLRGGYETQNANWSKFVPEAHDLIVAASIDVLHELFEKNTP